MEYNKKAVIKWVIIYLAIGALVYGLYYLLTYHSSAPSPEATNLHDQSQDLTINPIVENNQNQMENTTNIKGLTTEVLKEGSGESMAKNGDTVTVNYVGTLENGTKFDSSYDRNQPFSFPLGAGQVIKGWDLGVLGMKVGEKRKLTIDSDLGYGPGGYGPIPPNATLIFEVELLKIN